MSTLRLEESRPSFGSNWPEVWAVATLDDGQEVRMRACGDRVEVRSWDPTESCRPPALDVDRVGRHVMDVRVAPAPERDVEPDDRWGYRKKRDELLARFDAPGLAEALGDVTDALLQEARYHATWPVCTAEQWRYDRMLWVFDVMLGNVPADSHAPSAEDERYQ